MPVLTSDRTQPINYRREGLTWKRATRPSSSSGRPGFSGAGGELRYQAIDGGVLVQAQEKAFGPIAFAVELTGASTMEAADFVL